MFHFSCHSIFLKLASSVQRLVNEIVESYRFLETLRKLRSTQQLFWFWWLWDSVHFGAFIPYICDRKWYPTCMYRSLDRRLEIKIEWHSKFNRLYLRRISQWHSESFRELWIEIGKTCSHSHTKKNAWIFRDAYPQGEASLRGPQGRIQSDDFWK